MILKITLFASIIGNLALSIFIFNNNYTNGFDKSITKKIDILSDNSEHKDYIHRNVAGIDSKACNKNELDESSSIEVSDLDDFSETDIQAYNTEPSVDPDNNVELMAQLESLVDSNTNSVEKNFKTVDIAHALMAQGNVDENLLKEIIHQYSNDTKSDLGIVLFSVIERLQGEKVQQFASQMIRTNERDSIEKGLRILANQETLSDESILISRDIINDYRDDTSLVLKTLDVMVGRRLNEEQSTSIKQTLYEMTDHQDENIRESVLVSMGKLAQSDNDLNVVFEKLSGPDKTLALVSLYNSQVSTETVKDHLVKLMIDDNEELEDRQVAALALDRFSLSSDQYAIRKNIKETIEN